nr:hypothetical protein [Propionivibrio dicarboxylicus]
MLFAHRLIIERQRTARYADIADGKHRRLRFAFWRWRYLRRFEQIGKIVLPRRQTRDMDARAIETQLANHHAPLEQGRGIEVDMQLVKSEESRLAIALLDRQAIDIQRHGERIDVHAFHGNRAMQGFARLIDQYRFDNRRQDKEAEDCEQDNGKPRVSHVAHRPILPQQTCPSIPVHAITIIKQSNTENLAHAGHS